MEDSQVIVGGIMKTLENGLEAYEVGDYGRKMMFILYPDSATYNCQGIIDLLKPYAQKERCVALWILHDKDTHDDGTLKKAHWHVVLKFENDKSANKVAKDLGTTLDVLTIVKYDDWSKELLYLLHYEN